MKQPFLWYLASPYSHTNPKIKQTRFVKISKLAGKLIKQGIHVLCPIASSVPIAKYGKIDSTDWEYWKNLDINYVSRCDGILVSILDNEWHTSVGMRAEVEYAKELGIPCALVYRDGGIVPIDPDELLEKFDNQGYFKEGKA